MGATFNDVLFESFFSHSRNSLSFVLVPKNSEAGQKWLGKSLNRWQLASREVIWGNLLLSDRRLSNLPITLARSVGRLSSVWIKVLVTNQKQKYLGFTSSDHSWPETTRKQSLIDLNLSYSHTISPESRPLPSNFRRGMTWYDKPQKKNRSASN